MGCDIHVVIEKKFADCGWQCVWDGSIRPIYYGQEGHRYNSPSITNRNYRLFADLAGVRGDGPPPKGLPEDISPAARSIVSEWDGDGHSHSWDTMLDFGEKYEYPNTDEGNADLTKDTLTGKVASAVEKAVGRLIDLNYDDIDNYRVIYWFDN